MNSQFKKTFTKEEVIYIAKLARLDLTSGEIERMQKDLSKILEYFNLLKDASKPGEKFLNKMILSFREDKESPSLLSEEIIKSAPLCENSYIKVKSIL